MSLLLVLNASLRVVLARPSGQMVFIASQGLLLPPMCLTLAGLTVSGRRVGATWPTNELRPMARRPVALRIDADQRATTPASHRRSPAVATAWIYVIGRNAARASAHAAVIGRGARCRASNPDAPGEARNTETAAMDSHQDSQRAVDRGRRGCLVEGCPCKDARIVSRRRSAFFAAWARQHGETANRSIAPELGWRIPTLASPVA